MNKIIIDCSLEKPYLLYLIQAIKVFASKNKQTTLYVVGGQKDLGTLKTEKNIISVIADQSGRRSEEVSALCWKTMEEQNADVLLAAMDNATLKQSAKERLKEENTPFFLTRFLSSTPSRFGYLADSGYHKSLSPNEIVSICQQSIRFLKGTFLIASPDYAIVSPTDRKEDLPSGFDEAYSSFQGDKNFKKLVPVDQLLDGKCDLYLTDPTMGQSIIKATYQTYRIYHDKFIQYKNDDFLAKVAFWLGGKMIRNITNQTSARMDATGSFLLGYNKLVVNANPSTNYGGYLSTLTNIQSYLNHLIVVG